MKLLVFLGIPFSVELVSLEGALIGICLMIPMLLQTQALRVGQVKEFCIGLTQENSIENSIQDGLPYIQIPNGLCELFLTYPK